MRPLHWLFLILGMVVIMGLDSPGEEEPALRSLRYTTRSAQEAHSWQVDLRERLSVLLKIDDLKASKPNIPFNPTVLSTEDKGGYVLRELELSSTPGRRFKVLLTQPKSGNPPYPSVVCIHGHGGNRAAVHDPSSIYKGFAAALAERGVVTISAEVGQHKVYEENRTLMGERLWDVMRCVDFLETLPEVDKARIGCAGLSLGGEMAMWLSGMDERIGATVSAGFLTRMNQMEQGHCMCWKFDGLRELADWADIYCLIARRALQCQNGMKEPPTDFTVPLAQEALAEIHVIYKDLGAEDQAELDVHPGGHEVDLPGLLDFFHRKLKVGE